MDNDDVMAKTLKWKMRLDECAGVKPISWTSHSFAEVSERGVTSIERKLAQVDRNKEAVVGLTTWEGLVEADKAILRSFYRTYVLTQKSMRNTIDNIRNILKLKREIAELDQLPLEEAQS